MNLNWISDAELLAGTKKIFAKENELLVEQLFHFMEIDRRKLFSALKLGSLFQYAVKEIGYSEDQAHRRISAMKLLREFPEIEGMIRAGTLSLSNLGLARKLFKNPKAQNFTKARRFEVLEELNGKSAREAARIVASIAPEVLRFDRICPVSGERMEFRFDGPAHLQRKLERLKGMLAHSAPEISLGDLVDRLCDLGLKHWFETATSRDPSRQKPQSRAGVRRAVFARDEQCVQCGSTYALEEDHVIPKAMGGLDEFGNLRVLCRSCNQRAGIEKLGLEKMEQYLRAK